MMQNGCTNERGEQFLSLEELQERLKQLPGPTPAITSVRLWISRPRALDGKQLEAWKIGKVTYTTWEAYLRYARIGAVASTRTEPVQPDRAEAARRRLLARSS